MRNPRQNWIVGTVILSLILCVAAWFVVITPKLDSAAELDTQADGLKRDNAVLETKVKKLADQFTRIEQFRAELAALQVQLPVEGSVPAIVRDLDSMADATEVSISAINVSDGQEIIAASGEKKKELDSIDAAVRGKGDGEGDGEKTEGGTSDADKSADDKSADEKGADEKAAASKTAAKEPQSLLVSFPTSITFTGSFDEARTFLAGLQHGLPRFFLVSGIEATSLAEGESESGEKVEDGDVEFIVSGAFFLYTNEPGKLKGDFSQPFELPQGSDNPFRRSIDVADGE